MIGNDFTELSTCVACLNSDLSCTLDLGYQPLANDFIDSNAELEEYPLKLMRCMECNHSQISISVNPARLFRNYVYVSGTSDTLDQYFNQLANKIVVEFGNNGKILDIGSNDGSFLSKFKDLGWLGLGVDPAINLISNSVSLGVLTIPAFFNLKVAKLLSSEFDVVVAMNIFAHTSDPLDILLGIKSCLRDNGKAFIQTSQADMFLTGQFDTVYHEHISFFNVKSMKALLARADMYLANVTIVPIHGGSYLWEITKNPNQECFSDREHFEHNMGFYGHDLYDKFSRSVDEKALKVKNIMQDFRTQNFTVVSYGAAAKGNTFINFSAIKLDYIFDDTPQKIGKRSPAGFCNVSNPLLLAEINAPVLVLCPAWNFKEEILKKVRDLRRNPKDQFLTYFPEVDLQSIN